MNFETFLNQGWTDHAKDAAGVAARLSEGAALVTKADEIPQLAGLITHVFGEHLGRWSDGIAALLALTRIPAFVEGSESDKSIRRSIASLEVAAGNTGSLETMLSSDRVRVLAVAASALSEQKKTSEAQRLFTEALDLAARSGFAKEDPANRALAVTGNNLACALEETSARSHEQTELMLTAAKAARKFWEIAGGWMQVERSEYRLSQSYLKAGDSKEALSHAQSCLEICEKNGAGAMEFFYGYETLAMAERARSNSIGFVKALELMTSMFEKLTDDEKSWCKSALEKLKA